MEVTLEEKKQAFVNKLVKSESPFTHRSVSMYSFVLFFVCALIIVEQLIFKGLLALCT